MASTASIYLDTNFFIAAIEANKNDAERAQRLIEALRSNPGVGVTSEISLAELLGPTQRPNALPLHVKRRVYLDLLLWSNFIMLIPVSRDLLLETADLRSFSPLKLPDAIHLTSALQAGCRFFVSADKDFKNAPSGIEIINSKTGLTQLIAGLS